jgi:signal transduction histidine kinase/CheY-like chemotaxis protein
MESGPGVASTVKQDSDPIVGLWQELRLSPRPLLVAMTILAPIPYVVTDVLTNSPETSERLASFTLLLYGMIIVAWSLWGWQPQVTRWAIVIELLVVVHLIHAWIGIPGTLGLAAIPVALAVPLVSLPAAVMAAAGETVALVTLGLWRPWPMGPAAVPVALTAVWTTLGVMTGMVGRVREVTHWSWVHYQRALDMLEEARDRQVELKEILDDLANANLQLTRLNALAQGLRQVAEEARRVKEQFVANVSHELRTPLNMIIGFSDMILQAPRAYGSRIPPGLLADLTVIHRNAEHLANLIDDVLDLSQIEANQLALTKEYVRIDEVVDAAVTAVRPLFESKGLYLATEMEDDLPPVFCDCVRIREVLLNLLSNAGRFTERGGVHLRTWLEGENMAVSVSDTGAGIAKEDQATIFQPFRQLEGAVRSRYGGTGLGLSISRRFVELHGGRMWFESEEEAGTTFFFQIPVDPLSPATTEALRWFSPYQQHEKRARPSQAPMPTLRPKLVVMDTQGSLQRLLNRYLPGTDVVPAPTLEAAVREMADNPSQALLVNDLSVGDALRRVEVAGLPYGTMAMICSLPGAPGYADSLGVSDYLVKPVARDALLAALERLGVRSGTILVVDDEPDALRLFKRILTRSERGYRVLRARDGQEAMSVLRDHQPDAMFIDLVMPRMDGFQLLDEKNRDPALQGIPTIVISARDPAGQPVASNALIVTRKGGLSVNHLLTSITTISGILSTPVDPVHPEMPLE